MTYSDTQPRGTLKYRLLAASLRPSDSPLADPGTWGHEYVRHLAAELGEEYTCREQEFPLEPGKEKKSPQISLPGTLDDLRNLAKQCATFFLSHNAEPDAVDLLDELEMVDEIAHLVDENTFSRVCLYMIRQVFSLIHVIHTCLLPAADALRSSRRRMIFPSYGRHIRSTCSTINSLKPLP